MKKFLLFLFLLSGSLYSFAQTGACAINELNVQYIGTSFNSDGSCNILVNITWEQEANNGNKFTYFHIWQSARYDAFDYTNPSPHNAPMASDLSRTVGTLIMQDPTSATPTLYETYNPDPSYTKVITRAGSPNLVLSRISVDSKTDRFVVKNLVLRNLTCNPNAIYNFKGDVWSSQQSSGNNVHCHYQGISFNVNEVIDRSVLNCTPNSSSLQVQILSTNPSSTGSYKVYVDNTNLGTFDASSDMPLTTSLNYTTGSTAVVGGAWPYQFVGPALSIPSQYRFNNLWVVVNSGSSSQVFEVVNTCATLPSSLQQFTVARAKQNVSVKWQTVAEQSLKGFEVQRNVDGEWKAVGFVQSKSVSGNSASKLDYEFTDVNNFKGVSQYRLQEVSLDTRTRLSDIKSVRGEEVGGKMTVYPNPSIDGRINITFDNNNARDINVIDAAGRTVRQMKGVTNTVTIENLNNGFYSLHVIDRTNNEITTEKLIVKSR